MASGRTESQKTGDGVNKSEVSSYQNKPARKEQQKNTQAMWLTIRSAYINREDEPSINQLAGEFGISQSQLGRKAKSENWVSRRKNYWDKVGIKILKKCSSDTAERLIRNQKVVAGAIGYIVSQIKSESIRASLGDLDKLIRLEEFIHGGPDSRPDALSGIEGIIRELGKKRAMEHRDVIADDRKITNGTGSDNTE